MIKKINNKYVRRAVWLVAILPVSAVVVVLGGVWGAVESTKTLTRAAGSAW